MSARAALASAAPVLHSPIMARSLADLRRASASPGRSARRPARARGHGIAGELKAIVVTLAAILAVLWGLEIVDQQLLGGALDAYGVRPRDPSALGGVLAMPLLHGSYAHLISNSAGIIALGGFLLLWSRREFWKVTVAGTLVGGLGTWLLARPGSLHIGASGVLFAYLGYLLVRGWAQRSIGALAVSIAAAWYFGGLVLGMFPGLAGPGVSWEGHLFGCLGGVLVALGWRRRRAR